MQPSADENSSERRIENASTSYLCVLWPKAMRCMQLLLYPSDTEHHTAALISSRACLPHWKL